MQTLNLYYNLCNIGITGILKCRKTGPRIIVKSQSLMVYGVFEVLEVFTAVGPKI